ncbi:Clavaminate synthase-like protein [Stereum hirsutum FP-91666 SS1]|uniref:Clavaminate synthase-like protein n=1 Tax=Stereum hirsutum (strain FP-91666) TaxID=721885 RepID=UPI0004409E54|nr:Clavaminate synthase-like protein [Stereum hirsutum FP-91666 SS1]EIM91215.1 Clavaminate synthase-like protein [Stereum hirsutum FP-91666 SS1]
MLVERAIPVVSLKDFESRKDEIKQQLVAAAEQVGFFVVTDHGLTPGDIEAHFSRAKRFFSLPDETKRIYANPNTVKCNVGYDALSQFRPSTGQIDQKETLNLQLCRKEGWPSEDDVPGFSKETKDFMYRCHEISLQILQLFEDALGLEKGTFDKAIVPEDPESLSSMRTLHYLPSDGTKKDYWRNGPHADLSLLTLLFQREGEAGLEICPGREALTEYGMGDAWTPVAAKLGPIICNIGDMLMYWSDDKYKSIFHRVVAYSGPQPSRYSCAYFNHASRSTLIKGLEQKYPPMTGEEIMLKRMTREFQGKKAE